MDQIEKVVERYYRRFRDGETPECLEDLDFPYFVINGRTKVTVADSEAFRPFHERYLLNFRAGGYVSGEIEKLAVHMITETLANVAAETVRIRADGGREAVHAIFLLRCVEDGEWKILAGAV